ncbi:hypothetical protein N5D48_04640 [Pseudomonas sp. GD03858]|uniref:hypothetical protein n=1 Tax=unclassified Pseudomonas TaxID=196821 RepID=UPI002449E5A8|nr:MULTISPECIES: hypothetical protein [unclassified Pseudomonas]MDH0648646.1 hypothetical protein [Pseudomonas sp. GD03867]MDH0661679.1 hypothetical protein [Pseudomonas sp. GD03858]
MTVYSPIQGAKQKTLDSDPISPMLQVVSALPLLEDEEGIHTIPRAAQSRALTVSIPNAWDHYEDNYFPGAKLTFQIWMSLVVGNGIQSLVVPDTEMDMPADPSLLFPISFDVPERFLRTEGVFRLYYKVWVTQDENVSQSLPVDIFLDKTAPNNYRPGERVELKYPTDFIDDEYLERYNDALVIHIPKWESFRLEDVVEIFIEPTQGALAIPIKVEVVTEPFSDLLEVSIPGDSIRARGNGRQFLFYRLIDRAGNQGGMSYSLPLQLQLGVPFDLPLPEVPLALDGLIDLADALSGDVTVEIRAIPELLPGDQLQAFWNGRPLPVFVVESNTRWPASIRVSHEEIFKDGASDAVPCVVHYIARHGGRPIRSEEITFTVDLREAQGALQPVDFPEKNLWGWISCPARPWDGVRIAVPGNRGFWFPGEHVAVSWAVYRDLFGEGRVLVEKRYLPSIVLGDGNLDGFITALPKSDFESWLAIPLEAAAKEDGGEFKCSVIVDYRIVGRDWMSSKKRVVKVDLQLPGGALCRGDAV